MGHHLLNFHTNPARSKSGYMSPRLLESILKSLRKKAEVMRRNGSNCADVENKIKLFEGYY